VTTRSYTLLTDGASDQALMPILDWLLRQNTSWLFQAQWADLRVLREPPRTLEERIRDSLSLFPCDLLFVHRDAEREPRNVRVEEIQRCLGGVDHPTVCVVPVRMQESWLLFDEKALRRAAGNPFGSEPLQFPLLERLEQLTSPKTVLHDLLWQASGLRPGRRARFKEAAAVRRLADLIDDFSPLRALPAFRALEEELRALLVERSWT
jgi:hypothetical protein